MHRFPLVFLFHVGITANIRRMFVRKQQVMLIEAIEYCLGRIVSWGLIWMGFLSVPMADSDAFVKLKAYNPSTHVLSVGKAHVSYYKRSSLDVINRPNLPLNYSLSYARCLPGDWHACPSNVVVFFIAVFRSYQALTQH